MLQNFQFRTNIVQQILITELTILKYLPNTSNKVRSYLKIRLLKYEFFT